MTLWVTADGCGFHGCLPFSMAISCLLYKADITNDLMIIHGHDLWPCMVRLMKLTKVILMPIIQHYFSNLMYKKEISAAIMKYRPCSYSISAAQSQMYSTSMEKSGNSKSK